MKKTILFLCLISTSVFASEKCGTVKSISWMQLDYGHESSEVVFTSGKDSSYLPATAIPLAIDSKNNGGTLCVTTNDETSVVTHVSLQ